jgi:hypothetical protein
MSDTPDSPETPNIDALLRAALAAPDRDDTGAPAEVWEVVRAEARGRATRSGRHGVVLRVAAAVILLVGAFAIVRLAGSNTPSDVGSNGGPNGTGPTSSAEIRSGRLIGWKAASTNVDATEFVLVFISDTSAIARPTGPCWHGVEPTVEEQQDRVIVSLHETTAADVRPGDVCSSDLPAFSRTVHVALQAPVGGRTLFDASTTKAMPYFDGGRLLYPGYLPVGLHPDGEDGVTTDAERSWTRTYASGAGASVRIVQRDLLVSGPDPSSGNRKGVGARVHGRVAEQFDDPDGGHELRWQEDAQEIVVFGGATISVDELVRIAEGLQRPGNAVSGAGTTLLPGTTTSTTSPQPTATVLNGTTAGFNGARTGATDRELVLVFTGGPDDPSDPCWKGYVPDVREDATTVEVTIREARPADNPSAACRLLGHPRSIVVALAAPLGGRSLIDGGSAAHDTPVPVFDGSKLLEPTYVPAGVTVRNENGGQGTTAVPEWVSAYGVADPESGTTKYVFVVFQREHHGEALGLSGTITGHVDIGGDDATIAESDAGIAIGWVHDGRIITVSAFHPAIDVSREELIRIAEGLRSPKP